MTKHCNLYNFFILLLFIFERVLFMDGLDASCPENNACPTYLDYVAYRINPRCYCVPDVGKDPDVIITGLIGKSETNEVTTEDGYILTMFRMPKDNPKGVVVLWHPVVVNSRIWLFQGNQSTALWFWQQGYDVWLPNNRGTLYGKKHQTLSTRSKEFWNFSFHEIGYYDYKAVIDHIYNVTKSKIIFIGHSMSTTASFVYTSLRPTEAAEKLKVNIPMAPIANIKNIVTPVQYASLIVPLLKPINNFLHIYSIFALHSWYIQLALFLLLNLPVQFPLAVILSITCGWTLDNYDPNYANLLVTQAISSVSWKIFYHYAQIRNANGQLQMYDYGSNKNKQLYGSKVPPLYPIENITVPTYIVHSQSDTFSVTKDADFLYNSLQNITRIYGRYECKGLNHVDYHVGKNRRSVVYNKIFELLKKLET